jgi:zinc transporter
MESYLDMTHSEIVHDLLVYMLDGKGGATRIDSQRASERPPAGGAVWIHLDYSNPEHLKWLVEKSGLQPLVIDALRAEETRPRSTEMHDGLLVALRGINLNPGAEPHDMVSIRIWLENGRIITARKRDLVSIEDLIKRLEKGTGPAGTADFLVDLADRLVWHMSDTVDDFEDRVDDLEDQGLDSESGDLRFELATLRRQAIAFRRYLAPQREALGSLLIEQVSWLDNRHLLKLREVSDRLIRHIEDLDAVRERAAVTQEELLSRLSEQMNTRMYVLSLVAAIFLPLGFLTGMLGVNLGGIPGAENIDAFWIFTGLLIGVLVIQLLFFRWKKWL